MFFRLPARSLRSRSDLVRSRRFTLLVLRAEFPMLRTDVPLVPAAYRGDRDNRPIRVELPLLVAAPDGGSPGLTGAAAVESMLSHPQLALLVAEPAV